VAANLDLNLGWHVIERTVELLSTPGLTSARYLLKT